MTIGEAVAELDERFSDPGAKATPWVKAREVLETAQLSWVTTVRADGRPHVTPPVAVWLDDAAHFTTLPSRRHGNRSAGRPRSGSSSWDDVDGRIRGWS